MLLSNAAASFTSKSASRARSAGPPSSHYRRSSMVSATPGAFQTNLLHHGRRIRWFDSDSVYSSNKYRSRFNIPSAPIPTIPPKTSCLRMRKMSASSWEDSSSSIFPDSTKEKIATLSQTLKALEEETAMFNNGQRINVNSPRQVSQAVFGTEEESTKKEILKQAIDDTNLEPHQRKIAELVLQQREITSVLRSSYSSSNGSKSGKKLGLAASFSTVAVDDGGDDLDEDGNTPTMVNDEQDNSNDKNQEMTFEDGVDKLFGSNSLIDEYWKQPLLSLTKPVPRTIVSQLGPKQCPMGFQPANKDGGKTAPLLAWVREQKKSYPDCIILTRVGEFYETYGIDALLLMEHCGLNSMGGKARAGCRYADVQATLNNLVYQGFKVRVFEETNEPNWRDRKGIKQRFLAGTVTPASPTYLHNLVLSDNGQAEISAPTARPYVGIIHVASGYTYVEVSMEERTARVSEQLTAEAVACRLEAYPPADPLFYVPTPGEEKDGMRSRNLPFLPTNSNNSNEGFGAYSKVKKLKSWQLQESIANVSRLEQAKETIVIEILKLTQPKDMQIADEVADRLTKDDFSVTTTDDSSVGTHTNPLYKETAIQIGLLKDPTIPTLVSYLLPNSAPATCKAFLQRWLLVPPPSKVADAMSTLVAYLKHQGPPLPPLDVPPIGQVLSRLHAGQADVHVYRQILSSVDATIAVLEMAKSDPNKSDMIQSLMVILEYETNLKSDPDVLLKKCKDVKEKMEKVILTRGEDPISISSNIVPERFIFNNEKWRGSVKVSAAKDAYDKVYETARRLESAVAEDFWCMGKISDTVPASNNVVHDQFNNLIALRNLAKLSESKNKDNYFHPNDRNNKLVKWYTTNKVQDAMKDYLDASEATQQKVTNILIRLSEDVCKDGHIPAVVQAAYANLILSTANNHAAKATTLGWELAKAKESADIAGSFQGVWPYWMERSDSVENTFDLDGIFLLTAPNMSGKSTLMRSVAAAALLTNCGLCAPVGPGSFVRRFDNIFLRGASADVPTEGKSAFGAEMQDIAAMQRSCGEKSLVFVDELGRGTSPRDGTCIAGAVLEEMATTGMSGVFATHLHDIFNLPLNWDRITNKRMAIHEREESGQEKLDYKWTYKMEDGECKDSMALVTAKKFGLPDAILDRAQHFQTLVPDSIMEKLRNDTQDDEVEVEEDGSTSTVELFASTSSSTSPHLEMTQHDDDDDQRKTLDDAIQHAQIVVGTNADGYDEQIIIEAGYSAPAMLCEGRSCLYILELDTKPATFYVGETDKLQRRLQTHRKKKGRGWKNIRAYVLPVSDKSEARQFESRLIRELSTAGFDLESIADGSN